MFKRINRSTTMALAAVALLLSVAAPTMAQEEEAEGRDFGRLSLDFGVDFPTAYYFRGIIQEKHGFIAQPWAEIGFDLHDGAQGDAITGIDLVFGTWNSLHSKQTGAVAPGPDIWYESDFYTGLNFGIGSNWSAGVSYTAYTSPNNAFGTVQELGISAGFNNSAMWGEFGGLQPYVALAYEFSGQADGGSDKGVYLEIGIEPSFLLVESLTYPITFSVPVTVGLSLDGDYYEHPVAGSSDKTFGYLDVGGVLSMPLAFMGDQFGSWEAYAGAHFLYLGSSTEALNTGSNEDWEIIGSVGFSVSY